MFTVNEGSVFRGINIAMMLYIHLTVNKQIKCDSIFMASRFAAYGIVVTTRKH